MMCRGDFMKLTPMDISNKEFKKDLEDTIVMRLMNL